MKIADKLRRKIRKFIVEKGNRPSSVTVNYLDFEELLLELNTTLRRVKELDSQYDWFFEGIKLDVTQKQKKGLFIFNETEE